MKGAARFQDSVYLARSNRAKTVTILRITDSKHETVEYENPSFFVWDVGDQDKIRPPIRYPRTYDSIYVDDGNEN